MDWAHDFGAVGNAGYGTLGAGRLDLGEPVACSVLVGGMCEHDLRGDYFRAL